MNENKSEKSFSFLGKTSLVLFVVLAVFISWAIFKQINKRKEIQNEITQLQEEAARISRENFLAKERISYFESQDYQSREAKEKLNLRDPEENVVIVKPGIIKKEVPVIEELPITNKGEASLISNPIKWWKYFTHK